MESGVEDVSAGFILSFSMRRIGDDGWPKSFISASSWCFWVGLPLSVVKLLCWLEGREVLVQSRSVDTGASCTMEWDS